MLRLSALKLPSNLPKNSLKTGVFVASSSRGKTAKHCRINTLNRSTELKFMWHKIMHIKFENKTTTKI